MMTEGTPSPGSPAFFVPVAPRSVFPGALDLLDEAARHVRRAPPGALVVYYVGTIPFVAAFGAFILYPARDASSVIAPLAMIALFVGMKTAQAVFAVGMRARLAGQSAPRWTYARLARLALVQAMLQPSGLFLLPLAAVVTLPFGWACAFYGSVSALGDGESASARGVLVRAARAARREPGSNHLALLVLSLLGMFAWMNLALAAVLGPLALSLLTGHDNAWIRRGLEIFDGPFFVVTLGLLYLALDPWVKTFYALRCFQMDSLSTGEDLRAALHDLPAPPAPGAFRM